MLDDAQMANKLNFVDTDRSTTVKMESQCQNACLHLIIRFLQFSHYLSSFVNRLDKIKKDQMLKSYKESCVLAQ